VPFPGFDALSLPLKKTIILHTASRGNPTIQDKRDILVRGNPFSIIPPCQVKMGSSGKASLARGMTDTFPSAHVCAGLDTIATLDVHI
jgi:hypothetical protein